MGMARISSAMPASEENAPITDPKAAMNAKQADCSICRRVRRTCTREDAALKPTVTRMISSDMTRILYHIVASFATVEHAGTTENP